MKNKNKLNWKIANFYLVLGVLFAVQLYLFANIVKFNDLDSWIMWIVVLWTMFTLAFSFKGVQ